MTLKHCSVKTYANRGRPRSPQVFAATRVASDGYVIVELHRLPFHHHEPLELALVEPSGRILVDSILRGAGTPSAAVERVGVVRVDRHDSRAVQDDPNVTIPLDFGPGVVADPTTRATRLATNHRDGISVIHSDIPFLLELCWDFSRDFQLVNSSLP